MNLDGKSSFYFKRLKNFFFTFRNTIRSSVQVENLTNLNFIQKIKTLPKQGNFYKDLATLSNSSNGTACLAYETRGF